MTLPLLRLFLLLIFCTVQSAVAQTNTFKILVFSKTEGYRHGSIENGILAIQQLGASNNFAVDTTENAALFTDANLQQYRAVVFLSTTGDILDPTQQAAFERFIQAGKGYVGIHAASDTEYDWPWYADLVGAYFAGHPHVQPASILVADRAHPSTVSLPARWVRSDEWYMFNRNPRGDVHVLATIDEETYDGGGMGFDHPILWCHDYDGGRAWYTAGGHTEESFSEPLFLSHLLGGIQWAAGFKPGDAGATIEANFQKVVLDNNLEQPMSLAVAPDGRVFYVERTGRVLLYKPQTSSRVVAATLDVYSDLEDGVLGVVLDPAFAENQWIYLLYSPAGNEPKQHVSRFTVVGDIIDLRSEKILLEIPTQRDICCHSAGCLAFGPDGSLYISTGDNTDPFIGGGYSPMDEAAGQANYDAQRTSGNGNDLRGKILRIRPQANGSYTIPSGNLFPIGTPNTKPEIYVMGARNPFRISVDARTGWLYWGDVGPDAITDDANKGPKGYDEWNQTRSAGNYGWPYFIENNRSYRKLNPLTGLYGSYFNANLSTNNSPNNTGPMVLPPALPAWLSYTYETFPPMPELPPNPNRTAFAGPVYHFNTNLVLAKKLPPYFDKTLFLHDFYRNSLFEVKLDDAGNFMRMNQFLPSSFSPVIQMQVGPDGALYMLEWLAASNRLVRLEYGGTDYAPTVAATAAPSDGSLPLLVQFSSAGSQAIGTSNSLAYAWSFMGNGTINSTAANPTFTYTQAGNFNPQLTVTDSNGKKAVANVAISVGNTRPVVSILNPPNGAFYGWGDIVPYRLAVSDPEDGSSPGTISCNRLILDPAMGHSEHSHSQGQQIGCQGSFRAPLLDHDDGGNFFLLLNALYTDNGATGVSPLQGKTTFRLNPKRLQAEHASARSGVFAQTIPLSSGYELSGIDDGDWIKFSPVNLTNITLVKAAVRNSINGSRIEIHTDAMDGPLVGTINLGGSPGTNEFSSTINDPSGTHDLYFVFRKNPGATDLFALNWLDFVGNGVSPAIILQSSSSIAGVFTDDLAASNVEGTQSISVPITNAARFYRLRSISGPARLLGIQVVGGNAIVTHE